jgi:hypothetical protein
MSMGPGIQTIPYDAQSQTVSALAHAHERGSTCASLAQFQLEQARDALVAAQATSDGIGNALMDFASATACVKATTADVHDSRTDAGKDITTALAEGEFVKEKVAAWAEVNDTIRETGRIPRGKSDAQHCADHQPNGPLHVQLRDKGTPPGDCEAIWGITNRRKFWRDSDRARVPLSKTTADTIGELQIDAMNNTRSTDWKYRPQPQPRRRPPSQPLRRLPPRVTTGRQGRRHAPRRRAWPRDRRDARSRGCLSTSGPSRALPSPVAPLPPASSSPSRAMPTPLAPLPPATMTTIRTLLPKPPRLKPQPPRLKPQPPRPKPPRLKPQLPARA